MESSFGQQIKYDLKLKFALGRVENSERKG